MIYETSLLIITNVYTYVKEVTQPTATVTWTWISGRKLMSAYR